MISRDIIRKQLSDSLTSPAWLQLKHSLLGSELLALGTEIIYRAALAADSFLECSDYTSSSYCDLITYARKYNIPVSDNEPSYIIATASENLVPYASNLTKGGITFTAIKYHLSGDPATFYQGKAQGIYMNSDLSYYQVPDTFQLSDALKVNIDGKTYIRLSPSAIPESVRLVVKNMDGDVYEVPQKSPVQTNNDSFRLVTLEDGCLAIEIGDLLNTGTIADYTVYFLNATHDDFATTDFEDVLEVHVGSASNLDYARSQVARGFASTYVLNSLDDITSFVRTYPYVLDSKAEVDGIDTVNVYLKPVERNSQVVDYPDLLNDLYLHANIFMKFNVEVGKPVSFYFKVKPNSELTLDQRAQLENEIRLKYSYEELKFLSVISAADVSAQLYIDTKVTSDVSMVVSEPLSSTGALSMSPKAGTVKLYADGKISAWDNGGNLIGRIPPSVPYHHMSILGSFGSLMVCHDLYASPDGVSVYDPIYDVAISITSLIESITGATFDNDKFHWFSSATNPIFTYDGKTYVLTDDVFWHSPIGGGLPSVSLLKSFNYLIDRAPYTPLVHNVSISSDSCDFPQTAFVWNNELYYATCVEGTPVYYLYHATDAGAVLIAQSPSTLVSAYTDILTVGVFNSKAYIVLRNASTSIVVLSTSLTNPSALIKKSLPSSLPVLTPNTLAAKADSSALYLQYVDSGDTNVSIKMLTNISETGSSLHSSITNVGLSPEPKPATESALVAVDKGLIKVASVPTDSTLGHHWYHYDMGWSNLDASDTGAVLPGIATTAGTIDYNQGLISFVVPVDADTAEYESVVSGVAKGSSYYMLKEDVPVVWL